MSTLKYILVCFICFSFLSGCKDSPEKAYEKISKSNSISEFRKFIETYPNSPLVQKASDQIQELISILYATGIRQICFDEASEDSLPPWDKILQDNNSDIFALAMKGIAEAKKDNIEDAKTLFNDCKLKAKETTLAPYLLEYIAFANSQVAPLYCPLPANISKNALLSQNGSQNFNTNQFLYLDASSTPLTLLAGQGEVFLWEVPSENSVEIIHKMMDDNINNLSGT